MESRENPIDRAMQAYNVDAIKDLATAMSVPVSSTYSWKTKGELPLSVCIQISKDTGVSLDWLILGQGEKGETSNKALVTELQAPYSVIGTAEVPLYDVPASAGYGSFFENEHIIQQIPFSKEWLHHEGLYCKDLVCLPIHGDSMLPSLNDGDIVLINRAMTDGDGVFVLRMNTALRIKRLQWLASGDLRISSDNPIYDPETIDPDRLEDFEIIGACHTKISRVF